MGEPQKQDVTLFANEVIEIIKHRIERLNRMRVHTASRLSAVGDSAGPFPT